RIPFPDEVDASAPFQLLERADQYIGSILRTFRTTFGTARILIPISNALGHKASSIFVAKRLIELSAVKMIVIKPEREDVQQDSTKLLRSLHPELTWGGQVVVKDVVVVAEPARANRPVVKPIGGVIGFTGGSESTIGGLCGALKVTDAIMLQPPGWGK